MYKLSSKIVQKSSAAGMYKVVFKIVQSSSATIRAQVLPESIGGLGVREKEKGIGKGKGKRIGNLLR